jgi:hypothetical protein
MYAATYKQVPIGDSFGLLRKAERLEHLMPPLPPRLDKELTELGGPDEEANCVECGVDVSPRWWSSAAPSSHDTVFSLGSVPQAVAGAVPMSEQPPVKRLARVCHQCHCKSL